jgi:serine/threonine protein kinase/DNA-binding winged helix-turn-helix (wHTH) protein
MENTSLIRVRFGSFELDFESGELRTIGAANANNKFLLREQSLLVLRMLIERKGKIVTREEIRKKLWPNDTIVDFDHSINATIKTLRRALGDSADNPQYIETLARRGYRLRLPVEWLESTAGFPGGQGSGAPVFPVIGGLIGRKVSHYRVLEVIGAGGMGMVYKAEDLKLGRRVALKFLPEDLAGDAAALQRFEREAQTASALNHPNICTIYEIEEHEGQPFIVMELLQGDTLSSRISGSEFEALPLVEVFGIALQVCDALQAAHDKGIIHRDIKPANIFLTTQGAVKILDFGLAKLVANEETTGIDPAEASRNHRDWSSAQRIGVQTKIDISLTRAGITAGTAGYMSPEQVRKKKLDARTDLFSFGMVLYEMAAGRRAFAGETVAEIHDAILHETSAPAHETNPYVPRALDAVISKALEKDRERRYQSAGEMRKDLARVQRQILPSRLRIRRWFWSAALLAVIAAAFWLYWSYRYRVTLSATDTIVLADVNNATSDPVFDDALNASLRRGMGQTPYLNILGLDKVSGTLQQLKLPPATKLTPDVARQVCGKTNSKMVITQSISDAGNGYHLQMRALDCASGATLAREQADIGNRNEVVHELGITAARLRAKLGEPAASLARFNQPLEKALSASLEALQAGSQGLKLSLAGDAEGGLKFYLRAVELDPNFAVMHQNIGAAYLFLGNIELSEASYTRAYQLRSQLTEKDRLNAEITYYSNVTGDWEKEYSSVLRFLEIFPRDVFGHTNLRAAFVHLGQPDRAADEAAEIARLRPSSYYFGSAIQSIRFASRFNEAKSWLAKADALKLDNSLVRRERLIVAFATGDRDTVEKILKEEERGSYREDFLHEHSLIEIQQGRFHSAERLRLQALGRTSKTDDAGWWLVLSALEDAEVGKGVQSRRDESKATGSKLDRNNKIALALALARSGRTMEAGKLADQISAERPEDTLVQHYFIPTIRAATKLRQHNPAAAIDLLRGTARYDLAFTGSFESVYPAYIRGLAYLELGDGRSAAAQFQKLIDNPGFTVRHVTGPLAWLQLGHAQKMMGDEASARKSYETFLGLWKNADPDIPIYQQAKAEYARLEKGARSN